MMQIMFSDFVGAAFLVICQLSLSLLYPTLCSSTDNITRNPRYPEFIINLWTFCLFPVADNSDFYVWNGISDLLLA